MEKSPDAFRTISEVAEWLDTPAHVLRFWESRFTQVKPVKRAGGRRYYRPADMLLLGGIKKLLHEDGMTIRGVQKLLREQGVRKVASLSMPLEDGQTIEAPMAENVPGAADTDNVVPLTTPAREPAKRATDTADAAPADETTDTQTDADTPADTADTADGPGPDAAPARRDTAPAAESDPTPAQGATPQAGPADPPAPASADETAGDGDQPELAFGPDAAPSPEPLGADLTQEDPDDDAGPLPPVLSARLRDPALRRRLHDQHQPELARILARMESLAARMSDGG